MPNLLMFGLGFMVGAIVMIFIIALLNGNKHDEVLSEKFMSYEEGYRVGFDDGYELRQNHYK